jgi:hypothetical protein
MFDHSFSFYDITFSICYRACSSNISSSYFFARTFDFYFYTLSCRCTSMYENPVVVSFLGPEQYLGNLPMPLGIS